MNKNTYHWNKKNTIFKYNADWVLYAGETGIFIKITPEEKNDIDTFILSNTLVPSELLNKLEPIEAITKKSEQELSNIRTYRMLKKQMNQVFTLSICPENLEKGTTLSEEAIQKIVNFCKKKNQKNIRCFWNCTTPNRILFLVKKLFSELEINGISIYNGLISYNFECSEILLKDFINLRFNNFKILITSKVLACHNTLSKFLDYIETIFNFYKTNFYSPQIQIFFEINDENCHKIKTLKEYFKKRYGDFFLIEISFNVNIFECNDKLTSSIMDINLDKYLYFDKKLNYYDRTYLKKISENFTCSAQTYSSYIIDWNLNVLKCWKDLGVNNKSIYNLQKNKGTNLEVEYKYLRSTVCPKSECKKCFMINQCNGECSYYQQNFTDCTKKNRLFDFYEMIQNRPQIYEI